MPTGAKPVPRSPSPGSRHSLGMGAGHHLHTVQEWQQLPTGCKSGLQLPVVGQGFPTLAITGVAMSSWGSSCGGPLTPCARPGGGSLFSMQAGVPVAEEGR